LKKKSQIKLKPIQKKYLPILRDWRNSEGIWEFNTQFTLLNMINQKNWFEHIQQKNSDRKMFMIIYNDFPIGICGLIHLNKTNKKADVAIIIGNKKFHGTGLGYESLKKLVELGFTKFKLHKLEAEIFDYNHVSFKLFKKLNFSLDAIKEDSIWRNKQWHDIHVYSLLNTDFKLNLPS